MDTASESARTASAATLSRELAVAALAWVEAALDNPALGPDQVVILLKNKALTGPVIQCIARKAAWLKSEEVKAALVLHPKTPRTLAMNLVPFLWWRDLLRVADSAALASPLRRAAERILIIHLKEMALGEKVTLARITGRGLIAALRTDENPMVIRALLQNPRLVEEDALAIAASPATGAGVLRALSEDGRFAYRPAMQKALVQHPNTPSATALRILRGLSTRALKDLLKAPHVPQLVLVAARRLIETRENDSKQ